MKLKGSTIKFMFGASLMALTAASAHAQAPAASTEAPAVDDQAIVITGARNSERSAIQRKKRAATAQDSIVADDVGNFPDKNVGEAISRIAGVALDVSDAGDQGGFTIRGQGADLVRVEVDGMSMLPTDAQNGRSVTGLNDMSSDLIKSVDVVKGQTADMRPGGVGGTVRIEQRSGLDFKKPLYKMNLQYQKNTLDGKWSPRLNVIATRKFLDDRLGVLFNFTYDDQRTSTDFNSVSDKQVGYQPFGDHDNSPEKTFTQAYDKVAAAVTTKAGCAALPTTGINSRLNCYAQWEDFAPSLPRMRRENRRDTRTSFQLRADYRVNDDLTVFASYNPNIRKQDFQAYNLQLIAPNGSTCAGPAATPTANTCRTNGQMLSNMRNVVVNENHYITSFDFVTQTSPTDGGISTLNYDSQVRDIQRTNEQHYTQLGADYKNDIWDIRARVQYGFAKGEREDDAFKIIASIPRASFYMIPENGLWTFDVPAVDLDSPSAYYPKGTDDRPAAQGARRANVFQNPGTTARLEYTPQADKNSEMNYQIDLTRKFADFGPLKSVKFGASHTDRDNETWREGGFNIAPGVMLSRARSLDYVRFCDPAVTGPACNFGSSVLNTVATSQDRLEKEHMLTRAQYQEMIDASLITLPGANYFEGMPDRGNLINSWKAFDFDTLFGVLGKYADLSHHNLDCLYECIASDGKTYTRPSYSTNEVTTSAYIMGDFETRLFNMPVFGNLGVRYQKISVDAAPSVVFQTTTLDPTRVAQIQAGGNGDPTITTFVERRVFDIHRQSEDVLPSFNLAVWPIEDELVLRYSIAKQRARPNMTQLTGTSAATCNFISTQDAATLEALGVNFPGYWNDADADVETEPVNEKRCSGRIGNPELKGYGATTSNVSLEWYPNRDSQLSIASYSIDVKSGRPEEVTLPEYELEGNTYIAPTYEDGPSGLQQTGIELAGRTAFSFAPSILKYTGAGFNYSTTESNESFTAVDPLTGKPLPPAKQSSYYYNLNFWYDDGKLNARIAYQERDFYYDRIDASEGTNRVPNEATQNAMGINLPPYGGATSYFKTVTPVFKNKTKSLDARMSYKINKNVELFAEGKNLLNDTITRYAPEEYRDVGNGVPYVFDTLYYGRRLYFGVIATF
ncbi:MULTISPECIES: TonB-dependent receptor [Asticcacaulis]|uniref:TonB-dependent receptor n=1 Tax=Asticcacaulis TaxID=76890 RepID=UPI001AE2467E|nr:MULTISPECIES: TonB-dependent receptor [Asticcacaulis]MBP2161003.1 TonB-dependent receptor [Asticcacaulis solisilvae]MDR6802048.1 TonB-dependent receptor [Asticcacaulis sp. BE141]